VFKNDIDQLHIGLALKPDWVESSLLQQLYHVIQKQSEKMIYYAFFPSQDMAVYNQLGVVGSHVHVVQNLFYKDQLPKVKLMIVMRYHAAVWCALNGIPFIALSKDPKLDSISKSLGQECFLCYDSVAVASFNTLFNKVLLRLDHYTDIVVDKAKELIKQSEKHQELLHEKN
jgi:polysaccharide pyruvyl transferase WcaK-like protein